MNTNEFMARVRPNLRPVGMDTCPTCGKEKQTINRLLNSKAVPRCIPCWQQFEEEYEQPTQPVKKVAVSQETWSDMQTRMVKTEERLSELEGRVGALEGKKKR